MSNTADETTGLRLKYIATICAGSFLLFLVQPMVARMALPRLGGAPAVWNSAMLVYQALLLGGYAYAHFIGRFLPRTQAIVHLSGFALAALMLPIGLIATDPPVNASPFVWVPWLFTVSIGPLFFMISAQAPLMQRWFSLSGGHNPYPLYAASNLGSFGGLIAYPLIVEPFLPLDGQRMLWSIGYAIVLLLIILCAITLPRVNTQQAAAVETVVAPSTKTFLYWILLAAVPSGLMLSTSLHLTTDIVAMPLLWVLPLGLYLLSFSVAFAENRTLANLIAKLAPFILVFAAACVFANTAKFTFLYASLGLLMLFAVSAALHGEMFARRPDPQHLTRFYLAMSIGGVVGGIFCALIAPVIFNWGYEYPILIAASALLLSQQSLFGNRLLGDASIRVRRSVSIVAVALIISQVAGGFLWEKAPDFVPMIAVFIVFMLAIFTMGRRIVFALCIVMLMLAGGGWSRLQLSIKPGVMTRSFFGIYTVGTNPSGDRSLIHGTTLHGVQMHGSDKRERTPTTYYGPQSGVGLALRAASSLFGTDARISVVGLGAGTLACYAEPKQSWRIYEIDPAIVKIASDPKQFTSLSKCLPSVPIIVGDARLMLAREPAASADILIVDAFSSDSVPMHLLTREAFETYGKNLAPGGVLMIHISNRYLALEPVLAAGAKQGWTTRVREFRTTEADRDNNLTDSNWVAFAREPATLAMLEAVHPADRWREIKGRSGFAAWTDDYGSILPIIKMKKED